MRPKAPANAPLHIGNVVLPGRKKQAAISDNPFSKKLPGIVPERKFIKAAPRFKSNSEVNSEQLLSYRDLHEESATGSEEGSATTESKASSLSASEQSTGKIHGNSEQHIPLNIEQSSISRSRTPMQVQWQRKTTKHRKKLDALKKKNQDPSQQLKRQKAQSLPRELKSKLESSGTLESPSSMTELDDSSVATDKSKKHKQPHRPKRTILDLIPKRLRNINTAAISVDAAAPSVSDEVADTLEAFGMNMNGVMQSLCDSKLYQDASVPTMKDGSTMNVEHLGTLLPLFLESYLSALLKDDDARATIGLCRMTAEEAVAIRWYGLEGFQFVQPSLRQKPDPALGGDVAPPGTFESLVKACQRSFAKLPALPLDTELFRGTNFFDEDLNPGDEFKDPAFFSTSTSRRVAEIKFTGCYLLKIINIPANDPRVRDVSKLTGNQTEAEALFLPDSNFRVVSRGEGAPRGAGTVDNPEIITLEPIIVK